MSAAPRSIATGDLPDGAAPDEMRRVDKLVEQAALVMMPTGLILILAGWYGASRTPLLFEQIPYLISGGLFGLGLTIGGGLLYVGGWVARAAQLVPREAPLASVTNLLTGLGPADAAPADALLRTPTGSMVHRADCSIVAGRSDVVAVRAKEQASFRACGMCNPELAA